MNIFLLDWDTDTSAKYHCDKHVVKMIIEYAQILCSVHHVIGSKYTPPYRLSHKNHPCNIWARTSLSNYNYLCKLGISLSNEYTHRYGKLHKSGEVITWCNIHKPEIIDLGITQPALAMPIDCKLEDPIASYRNFYIKEKKDFCTWKNRNVPYWFTINQAV